MSHDQPKNPQFARIFFAILTLIIVTMGSNAFAASQDSLPLDVVLVMDSSGSMKRTDPQELRKSAAKLLISLLGAQDRASVVSFSDQGYPVAYLTSVKGKKNEAALFSAVNKISNKGVYTNLLGAVQAAIRVFKRNALADRKRVIVLMTDGKMDLGDAAKNQADSATLLNDVVPQLKKQNIELHTVAFTDQSDKTYLENLANASGGKFNLAQTDKQLHEVFTAIFEQNKQPNMLPFNGEKFTIDNAVKEVTIVGSKESEDVVLSLIAPDGDFITAENKPHAIRWFTAQNFDLITIQNPIAGVWRLKSSTGKNKAYIITDLKFQLQVEPQDVEVGEGVTITAWLEDKGKTLDKPTLLANLSVELRVYTPDGQTHVLDMQPQYKNENNTELSGVYVNRIALPADGRYQIEVIAKGSTFSRVRTGLIKVAKPIPASQSQPPASVPTALPEIKPIKPPVEKPQEHTAMPDENASSHAPESTPQENPEKDHQDVPAKKPVAEKTSPEKPSTAHTETEKSDAPETPKEVKHEGPDLLKAFLIFLAINAVFVVIGAIAYFIYRRRAQKAAGTESDDEEERDNDRKAA